MNTQVTSIEGETPSMAVVVAVAKAKGVDPLELEPLGEVIDPEALDRIFAESDDSRTTGWLTFRMADCEVTVTSDGELSVTPKTDAESEAAIEDGWETTTADG
ncbi:HalOD1 output domain-containing protein [Halalkalicoccus salilacus]|uniref:HalOD1 output domain-containing protein n=2 Tax=Halococcaceae TaxID=1963270 RepID=UPI00300F3C4B